MINKEDLLKTKEHILEYLDRFQMNQWKSVYGTACCIGGWTVELGFLNRDNTQDSDSRIPTGVSMPDILELVDSDTNPMVLDDSDSRLFNVLEWWYFVKEENRKKLTELHIWDNTRFDLLLNNKNKKEIINFVFDDYIEKYCKN